MKYRRLLIPSLVAFVTGALLSPSGGHGGLARNVRELEAKFSASKSTPAPGGSVHALIGRTEDTRLSHLLSALQEPSALKRGHDLYLATQGLSGPEIVEMMEATKKLPDKYASAVREALMARWFDADPAAAESWLRSRPTDQRAWLAWAAHFPERAMAESHEHPGSWRADQLLEAAIRSLPGMGEAKAAAEKLLSLPSDHARDQVLGAAVRQWAGTDPDAAFAFAHQLPLGEMRNEAMGVAMKVIAKKDPFRAMQMANELLPEYWKTDSTGLAGDIAQEVAKKDFAAAQQWVEQMPAEQRGRVAQPLVAKLVETDPVRALEWGSANGADLTARKTSGVADIVGNAMRKSPAETLRWIEAKPDGPDRDRLLERALNSSWTASGALGGDAAQFNSLLGQLPPDSRLRVVNELGAFSGNAATAKKVWDWIGTLDDEPSRLEAIKSISAQTARHTQWQPDLPGQIPQFSDAASHDAVIMGEARESKPEQAAESFLQISDPQTQQNAFDHYMPDWLHKDTAKAEAWLKQNGSFSQQQIDAWKEEGRWAH